MTGPSRLDLLIATAQEAVRDLRSYNDRDRETHLDFAFVQSLLAVAVAFDNIAVSLGRLADVLTTEEKP